MKGYITLDVKRNTQTRNQYSYEQYNRGMSLENIAKDLKETIKRVEQRIEIEGMHRRMEQMYEGIMRRRSHVDPDPTLSENDLVYKKATKSQIRKEYGGKRIKKESFRDFLFYE